MYRLLIPVFLLIGRMAAAQTPTPNVISQPQYYDKGHSALVKLDKCVAKYGTHTKGMGLGGYSITYDLNGDKATTRLQIPENGSFVVLMADGTGDPTAWFSLFKAEIKKGKRSAAYVQGKTGMVSAKQEAGNGIIPFEVKSLGKNLYEIIPSAKLGTGEYLFINKGTMSNYGGQGADAFAFGID